MNKYGEARVEGSKIVHVKGTSCRARPPRDWSVPTTDLKLVAEFTTPDGPVFDYFYIFVAGVPPRMYQIPMESLEATGVKEFSAALGHVLGTPFEHRLANSTDYASSVIWPAKLAGEPVFAFVPAHRTGLLGRLLDAVVPRVSQRVLANVTNHCGGDIEWAV